MLRLAQGVDNREVEANREGKSISCEQTFATDITDKDILLDVLLSQVEDVAQRLRLNKLEAKRITLKLLGFGASGLQEAGSGQHQLFPEPDQEKQKRLDEAFDRIRDKFGHNALRRGK